MNKNPANLWIRFIAEQIDSSLFWLPHIYYFTILAASLTIPRFVSGFFFYLIALFFPLLFLSILYRPLMTHYFGGSIGKLLSGLTVTDLEHKKLTISRSLFRYTVGYAFSGILFGLGFLSILKDKERMGWHDKAVGSRVYKVNNLWPLALVVLILLWLANLMFLGTAISSFAKGPLPSQFIELNNDLREEKLPEKDPMQETFLPPNTHIGVVQQNN